MPGSTWLSGAGKEFPDPWLLQRESGQDNRHWQQPSISYPEGDRKSGGGTGGPGMKAHPWNTGKGTHNKSGAAGEAAALDISLQICVEEHCFPKQPGWGAIREKGKKRCATICLAFFWEKRNAKLCSFPPLSPSLPPGTFSEGKT